MNYFNSFSYNIVRDGVTFRRTFPYNKICAVDENLTTGEFIILVHTETENKLDIILNRDEGIEFVRGWDAHLSSKLSS